VELKCLVTLAVFETAATGSIPATPANIMPKLSTSLPKDKPYCTTMIKF